MVTFFKLSALESKSRFLLTSFQVIEVSKLTLFAIFLFRFAELFIPSFFIYLWIISAFLLLSVFSSMNTKPFSGKWVLIISLDSQSK